MAKRTLDAKTIASIILRGSERELEDKVSGSALVSDVNYFKPIFVTTTWKDPTERGERISVVLVLPSGSSEFEISVEDGGEYLNVQVKWPAILYDENMP